ncbi:unnamed protein product [Caenorhabditis sp. 36 PRJEB53466]|nr:unnamed protein product [Caenorhabditis sp. 36 PRJEB53466]
MYSVSLMLVSFVILFEIREISTFPINYGSSINSVHSDDLSAENDAVIRKNETMHERVHHLQEYFNGVSESKSTWRDSLCNAFHSLFLYPPNCFAAKDD